VSLVLARVTTVRSVPFAAVWLPGTGRTARCQVRAPQDVKRFMGLDVRRLTAHSARAARARPWRPRWCS